MKKRKAETNKTDQFNELDNAFGQGDGDDELNTLNKERYKNYLHN